MGHARRGSSRRPGRPENSGPRPRGWRPIPDGDPGHADARHGRGNLGPDDPGGRRDERHPAGLADLARADRQQPGNRGSEVRRLPDQAGPQVGNPPQLAGLCAISHAPLLIGHTRCLTGQAARTVGYPHASVPGSAKNSRAHLPHPAGRRQRHQPKGGRGVAQEVGSSRRHRRQRRGSPRCPFHPAL